jgi:hypothetical protein
VIQFKSVNPDDDEISFPPVPEDYEWEEEDDNAYYEIGDDCPEDDEEEDETPE